MGDFFVLAEAASSIEPGTVGVSITSLLGSLGAAGAAVVVTYYFLGYLKDQAHGQERVIEQFKVYQSESQRKFQDQLDRLTDRQAISQHEFQNQVSRITDAQNSVVRDSIAAMQSIEQTMATSSATVDGIQKTIESLRLAVRAIAIVVRRTTGASLETETLLPAEEKSP
jgi:hypothetical protein